MFAVIETGGKQYKVEKGNEIWVEKLPGEENTSITFDRVLMVGDDKDIQVGADLKASVVGKIVKQGRRKKILVFRQRRRKRYRRIKGHRQHYTAVAIEDIEVG